MKIHALTLQSGDDLLREIENYISTRKIAIGVVLSAVGDVCEAKLINSKTLKTTKINEDMDILSVSGTMSQVRNHLHVVFGRASTTVLGGHLPYGCVIGNSAEIIIGEFTPEETINGDIPVPQEEPETVPEPEEEEPAVPESKEDDKYDELVTNLFKK